MRRKLILILVLTMFSLAGFSQSDGNYDYSKEFIWGINKNTNGGLIGGFVMKFSTALTEKTFRTIGIEMMNVKHPKESRTTSLDGNQFIYGKSNYLYAIRFQYGRDFLVFRKAPQQGVQIIASLAVGPTIGVVAPYYVKNSDGSKVSQYDPDVWATKATISGTGTLFQGLGESSIKSGINLKTSLLFEMGAFKSNVTGFEIGAMLEAYTGKVILMPQQDNRSVFLSAFLTLFYGSRK